jgi:hypothetical protein
VKSRSCRLPASAWKPPPATAEMKAFHGWTISLLESDISIVAAVETPEVAGKAVGGLKESFAELCSQRLQNGFRMMHRLPSAFNGVIRY